MSRPQPAAILAFHLVAGAMGCLTAGVARAGAPPQPARIAVFPFEIIDTSGEASRPDRAQSAANLLAVALKRTGRYDPVDLTPYAHQIAGLQRPDECGTCWADVARKAGAQLEVLPSVHKVSTLITLMTLWIADVRTMQYTARVEGQIRGDTEEAYARGIDFLVTQELDKPHP